MFSVPADPALRAEEVVVVVVVVGWSFMSCL